MPYNSFYEEILRNKVHILLCKILKIYDAIFSLVLRRGFLIRCAILVYKYCYSRHAAMPFSDMPFPTVYTIQQNDLWV